MTFSLYLIKCLFLDNPGSHIAGVIGDVGSAVERLHVDDQVYGNVATEGGVDVEYIRAEEDLFALQPTNLTMEEAAAIPMACEISYQALFLEWRNSAIALWRANLNGPAMRRLCWW